jgi:hypothetical protein
MWMTDIGRQQASNYSLLRTVFELNLQLFQKAKTSKTLLLFVIRDHYSDSPLSVLQDQILKDIDGIWKKIIKSPEFESSTIFDFFDFHFVSLPHKKFQEKEWNASVENMKKIFIDPNNPHFVFLDKYKKSVPIDGFHHYASAIWDVIVTNKDLDIPTQKEMLAMYRCGEIAKEIYVKFEEHATEWKKQINHKQIISKFGEIAKQVLDEITAEFDKQTSLYVRDVALKRRAELEHKIKTELLILYNSQLDLIRTNALEFFQKLMTAATAQGGILTDFTIAVAAIKTKIIDEFFIAGAVKATYPGEQWDYENQLDTLRSEIDRFIVQARTNQLNSLITDETKTVSEEINANMTQLLNNPTPAMWANVREALALILKEVEQYMTDGMIF